MDNIEIAETCEKAAAFLEEKGRIKGKLWINEHAAYRDGPACLVGALAISAGHSQSMNHASDWFVRSGVEEALIANLPTYVTKWNDTIASDEDVTTMLRDVAKQQRDNG